jgi:GTP cyclohydrolase IA
MTVAEEIRAQLIRDRKRYWACDNISDYVTEEKLQALVEEATQAYEKFLDALLIDRHNDPNSYETAKRVAKMFIFELLEGRFQPKPKVTAFPNDDDETRYTGLINVRAEIKSMCSHHHQPVRGICFIGLIPSTKVIGLSKYVRIAQWCARRGTLQEELARQIADQIMKHTGTEDVGVYIQGVHGCMENRGVCAHSSLTQTSIVHGQFFNPSVKNEWMDQVKLQITTGGPL